MGRGLKGEGVKGDRVWQADGHTFRNIQPFQQRTELFRLSTSAESLGSSSLGVLPDAIINPKGGLKLQVIYHVNLFMC